VLLEARCAWSVLVTQHFNSLASLYLTRFEAGDSMTLSSNQHNYCQPVCLSVGSSGAMCRVECDIITWGQACSGNATALKIHVSTSTSSACCELVVSSPVQSPRSYAGQQQGDPQQAVLFESFGWDSCRRHRDQSFYQYLQSKVPQLQVSFAVASPAFSTEQDVLPEA
jgi:hypothetical protein